MAEIQPLLVLDTTAILATQPLHWQEWDRFGQIVLPRAVMTELHYLTQQAIEPEQESSAREFLRFAATSDYWLSTAQALVGQGVEDQTLSKRARLEQAVAECSYALSQQQVGTLVVLVSNDRGLVNRILQLQIVNLCAISVAELLQWQRQHQRPQAVEQTLSHMSGPPIPASAPTPGQPLVDYLSLPVAAPKRSSSSVPPKQSPPRPPRAAKRPPQGRATEKHPVLSTLQTLFNFTLVVISMSLLAASGLVAWRVADRQSSEPVWQWLKLPEIPGLYPEIPEDPAAPS